MLVSKYRIRWRYDWVNRAPLYGQWSMTTKNEVDQAWNKQKDGLLWASVEGKTIDYKTVTLCQVPGQDFCFFQFHAVNRVPLRLVDTKDGQKLKTSPGLTEIHGIVVVMRTEKIFVFDTGHIFREPRTAEDLAFKYAAYGK